MREERQSSKSSWSTYIESCRRHLQAASRWRERRVFEEPLLDFSSNDYLGLSTHPALVERAKEYLDRFGCGSRASPLVTGFHRCHQQLEKDLAHWLGKEEVLLFPSGFQLNCSLIPALVGRGDHVILDRLCHGSLVLGAQSSGARLHRFHHQDLQHLEKILKKLSGLCLVVAELLYSMDGDVLNVPLYSEICGEYGALSLVDEAHGIGVLGEGGRATSSMGEVDFVLGTFSKGWGCQGGYVATKREWQQFLLNHCKGYVYSTHLAPPCVGSIQGALELMPHLEEERRQLERCTSYLRKEMGRWEHSIEPEGTHLIPLIVGEDSQALRWQEQLANRGMRVVAIRPPTVPEGQARLRVALSSQHTLQACRQLLEGVKECGATAKKQPDHPAFLETSKKL